MPKTKVRIAISFTLGATVVLTGCGKQVALDANGPRSAGADSAVAACDSLVDGKEVTAVRDTATVTGAEAATWLRGRTPDGAYSPTQLEAYAAVATLDLCLVDAPGVPYPHPQPVGDETETQIEPVAGIYVIGLQELPVIESMGPQSEVDALWKALPSE